jgi:hypothetical protein
MRFSGRETAMKSGPCARTWHPFACVGPCLDTDPGDGYTGITIWKNRVT